MAERLASGLENPADGAIGNQREATPPIDGVAELARQIPADRFEVLAEPLGWRCRCGATVSGRANSDRSPVEVAARLAESAADHAMYCGRCDD